uniref:hypothetical protein n=1 Tax=Campylaephora boydenii TaxID=202204 RepID=UPI002551E1D3|nr:hypothetical protein QQR83_pgp082 [Campylaephora boydenii]WGT74155.1 hypothetical protein [Campylaephora boydenii]
MNINLLHDIEGTWKYQQTIYSIKTKRITNNKNSINIVSLNLEKKDIYRIDYNNVQYLFKIIDDKNSIRIDKNNKQRIYELKINQQEKTKFLYNNKKVKFEEIFHIINTNFFLVIGILKQYNKCLYISVTSFIKIL